MPHPESFHPPEHKEPLPEALDRWLREDLPRQYKDQTVFLREAGLLELLPEDPNNPEHTEPSMGILGIDGKPYSIPTPEAIQHALTKTPEAREMYATKIDQGFTDLQLTPFGKPLEQLQELLRRSILQHHKEKKLFSSDGTTPLELDTSNPLYVWDKLVNADVSGDLVYFPERFDQKNHGGKTKQQLLDADRGSDASVGAGWNVILLEPDPTIPRQGKGTTIKGRKRLETNTTPHDYLKTLQTIPVYSKESGLTPEDWIVRFLHELQKNNRVLNDYNNPKDALNFLLASYHPSSGDVPYGYWNRGNRQARVGGSDPGGRGGNYGSSPAVRIR